MPKVDNYIKFLNAFYEWEQQHSLTIIQEVILMRILRRFNRSGWSEWVKIPNWELMLELDIKNEKTFRDNRDRLIQLGLIQVHRGSAKGKPSSYKLNMPIKKEVIYTFDHKQKPHTKMYVDKKELRTNLHVDSNVVGNVVNSCDPYEQCVSNTPKHKTINNKLKKSNTNVLLKKESPKVKYNDVLSLYHEVCSKLSKVAKLSGKRKKAIDKMFCLGYTLKEMKQVFEMANNSNFLCGQVTDFRANFDWLMKEDNFLKVLENTYVIAD